MPTAFARLALAVLLACALVACASTTPRPPPEPPYQPMDNGVPELDVGQAVALLNALRQTAGAQPVAESEALSARARALASTYALAGAPGTRPGGVQHMRYMAGAMTFADALTAWRAEANGTSSLIDPASTTVGIAAVVFDGPGAYWVLLIG